MLSSRDGNKFSHIKEVEWENPAVLYKFYTRELSKKKGKEFKNGSVLKLREKLVFASKVESENIIRSLRKCYTHSSAYTKWADIMRQNRAEFPITFSWQWKNSIPTISLRHINCPDFFVRMQFRDGFEPHELALFHPDKSI